MSIDNMIVRINKGSIHRNSGEPIRLPLADYIAKANGFTCMERMAGARAWIGKSISIRQDTLEMLSSTDPCALCNWKKTQNPVCSACGGSGKVPL